MNKKILIVVTSSEGEWSIPRKTGYWLGEVTHFHKVVTQAGYETDIASPKGGKAPLDVKSVESFEAFDKINKEFQKNPKLAELLENTLPLSKVRAEDYCAIYFAGGHGVMWDFPSDKSIAELSKKIYESGGVVAAVCHGPAGLLGIKLSNGKYLIEGKSVTGFANIEESLVRLTKLVPFLLQDELQKRGGIYKKNLIPFAPFAIADGRLVTGQNPYSAKATAEKTVEILNKILEGSK